MAGALGPAGSPLPPALADWPEWPEYGLVDELLPVLEAWAAGGLRYALATLVRISGSSPRPLGSEMAINARGECAGYVSGGCVEPAVVAEALAAMAAGRPRLLDYGAGSAVLDPRLSCGGRIHILVEPVAEPGAEIAHRRARARARSPQLLTFSAAAGELLRAAGLDLPCAQHSPRTRLVVVGADPVALALARLAPVMGLETRLLRPQGPASAPPGAALAGYERRPLPQALAALELDAWTAVYTLLHDLDDDHAVLRHALRSPAFCVGALGSQRKAGLRRQLLRDEGFDEAGLRRLHTPAGLWIRARTPQQIALSIVGQVLEQRPD